MRDGLEITFDETLIDTSDDDTFGRNFAIAVLVAFQGLFCTGAIMLVTKVI